MSLDDSGDEDFGFPGVGEGVDDHDQMSDHVLYEQESDFCPAEQSANDLSLRVGGQREFFDTVNSSLLPVVEPTVGSNSVTSAGSQSPGNSSLMHESSMAVTPVFEDKKRRRISAKRPEWELLTSEKWETPHPKVFMRNNCFLLYKHMPRDQKAKVVTRVRVKRFRILDNLKHGEMVTYQGKPYSWPDESEKEEAFRRDFTTAFFFDLAACPTAAVEERGFAMDRLIIMEAAGVLTSARKQLEEHILRQQSILLTYQGFWGLLDDIVPPADTSIEDLTQLVKKHVPTKTMFERMYSQYENLTVSKKINQFVLSQEICVHTWITQSRVRVHFHTWIKKGQGMTVQLEDVCWMGSCPHVNISASEFFGGRGSRSAAASYSGAFYLQVEKIGAVRHRGTILPFTGYHVKDYWITTLLTANKISFATARTLYMLCVVRAEYNVRQLDYVERMSQDMQAAREKDAAEAEILKSEVAFKSIPEVEDWKKQFISVMSRYKFLVLDGPSRTGKTRFAYSLRPPPTSVMGSPTTPGLSPPPGIRQHVFYADCSGGLPDLRQFRRKQHRVLVLDELHPKNAVLLKKILQSSNDEAIMGASPTMQHAYRVNSYQTMIVVTTNTWASGLEELPVPDVQWLKVNAVYVHVTTPLWNQ